MSNSFGGIEQVSRKWMSAYQKCQNVDDVKVLSFKDRLHKGTALVSGEEAFDVQFTYSSQPFSIGYVLKFLKIFRGYDIVHVHYPNIIAAFLSLFVPRKSILVLHWHADVLNKGFISSLFANFVAYLCCSRASVIIATSPDYAAGSKVLSSFARKINVIPLTGSAVLSDAKLDNPIRIPVVGKFALSVGRMVPYKGFLELIDFWADLSLDLKLVIVGDGPLKESIENRVRELSLQDKVFIYSGVSNQEIQQFYHNCEFFCLNSTSRAEAFGVVLIEALSFGKPLLTTRIPDSGVNFVNPNGLCGLSYEIADKDAFIDCVQTLVGNTALYNRFSSTAKERFETLFSDDTLGSSISLMIEKLRTID